ncbi:MAG: UDP-N-acetylglucosamine 2-epimerase (non-hydrolyzing) [Candidatus Bathyarchaeota archaeon]
MKISIILGTRPEIIKMSPIIRECEALNLDFFILHTGQHYSYNMDKVFFEQLKLPSAKYNLDIGPGSHAEQTGKMLIGIEKILQEEEPDVVLVEGDTNTVLAGAIASVKLGIPVGHVEAGLRSYDRNMPEEINRILADHSSTYLFSPTEKSKEILLQEGVDREKIFLTGNTIVDAVFQNLQLSKNKFSILDELKLERKKYFLVTIHRQENVDNRTRFSKIIDGLDKLKELGFEIIYPIHPRAKKQLELFGLKNKFVKLIEPLDYLSFLQIENNARLILTDSGGVQEESCILGVPCVTLRDNTERPETLDVGANILAGVKPNEIFKKSNFMLQNHHRWNNPFGDGTAGKQIIQLIKKLISR